MKQYKKVEKHKKKHKEEEKQRSGGNNPQSQGGRTLFNENAKDQIEYNEGDPFSELFDDEVKIMCI